MNYTEEQEIFSYKNWSLIQKEDIQALQDLEDELKSEWLEWKKLEEALQEWAWLQDIIILEWEENGDYEDWDCSLAEAQKEYNK